MRDFVSLLRKVVWLEFLLFLTSVRAKTIRYRSGTFLRSQEGEEEQSNSRELAEHIEHRVMTVSAARIHCRQLSTCVSFSFFSPGSRFPQEDVHVYFFPFADWHVHADTGEPAFVDDPTWHSYVNTTREQETVSKSIHVVLEELKKVTSAPSSNLRGNTVASSAVPHKLRLLQSLFFVAFSSEHRLEAAELIAPDAIELANRTDQEAIVRVDALKLLVVLGDSSETGIVLWDAGFYPVVEHIIRNRTKTEGWNDIHESALNVLSNVCLYRSVIPQLHAAGALNLLREIMTEPGFPGLQATQALAHLEDSRTLISNQSLSPDKIVDLVSLLRNAIDGDIVYGVKWDLIPGPLSAIKYLVLHSDGSGTLYDSLLDAGLMEELLSILEDDCLNAVNTGAVLEILKTLLQRSERARPILLLSQNTIQVATQRLDEYNAAALAAHDLIRGIDAHLLHSDEL